MHIGCLKTQHLATLVAACLVSGLAGCASGEPVSGPAESASGNQTSTAAVDGGSTASLCVLNADCGADKYCLDGQCVSPDGGCSTHADCPTGEFCKDSSCVSPNGAGGTSGSSGADGKGPDSSSGGSSGGSGSSGGRSGPPALCKTDTDCEGKCSPGSAGCKCSESFGGKRCLATCDSDKDCPKLPDGKQMTCTKDKSCAPQGKGGGGKGGGGKGGGGDGGKGGGN